MSRLHELERRRAELAGLRLLLKDVSNDPYAAPLLKSKVVDLETGIAKLEGDTLPQPETDLFFINGAALGSEALEAKFASLILSSYPDIIANQYAAAHGILRPVGRRIGENHSKVFLTALPRGSFGLRLAQPQQQDFVAAAEIADIMERASGLLDAAAQSDVAFDDALEFFHPRVLPPLKKFIAAIANSKGSLRIISGSKKVELTSQQIATAKARVDAAKKEEKPENYRGIFGGNLLISRKFELTPSVGTLIEGNLAADISDEQAQNWTHLAGQFVEARILVVRVTTRSGPKKPRYELLNLKSAPQSTPGTTS